MDIIRPSKWLFLVVVCCAGCSSEPPTPEELFNELAERKKAEAADLLAEHDSELRNFSAKIAEPAADVSEEGNNLSGDISFEYPATSFREVLIHGFSAQYRYSAADARWNFVQAWQSKGKDREVVGKLLVRHAEIKALFENSE